MIKTTSDVLTQDQDHCLFNYIYRDASNYKTIGTLLLSGTCTNESKNALLKCMGKNEYFIAEQVGIPSVNEELWDYTNNRPSEDDHCWHEFLSLRPAKKYDLESYVLHDSLENLIKSFQDVVEWNIKLSSNFKEVAKYQEVDGIATGDGIDTDNNFSP